MSTKRLQDKKKRKLKLERSLLLQASEKKMKHETIHAFHTLLSREDEFTYMTSFLKIGEVIMLSLTCKSIYNLMREHLKILFPYFVVFNSSSVASLLEKNDVSFLMKEEEWSIGRALKTHRRLVVNRESFLQVNEIFDRIIERKELEKLSRVVFVNASGLDISKVFGLFGKPSGQLEENVKLVTLLYKVQKNEELTYGDYRTELPLSVNNFNSAPIGFFVKELIIEVFNISVTNYYQILSLFRSLEKLKLSIGECISDNCSIRVPIMEKLKYLELIAESSFCDELKLLYDLMKLTPNLEYLDIFYEGYAITDDFLLFLTEKCPNLKGISIQFVNYALELRFTDQGIEKFLKGVPKLEYLNFGQRCNNVSGEILTKIGQFSNLRSVNINRGNLIAHLVDQYDNLYFGGGTLQNLEYLSIGTSFSLENATQSAKDKFITSLVDMAPNIKDIGSIPTVKGIDIFYYMDKLCPLLTVFPQIRNETEYYQITQWLTKTKKLESLVWEFSIDISNLEPIPSVKKLRIEKLGMGNLLQLTRVFPSVTELVCSSCKGYQSIFINLMKKSKWPDLKIFNGPFEEPKRETFLQVRPNIYGNKCELKDEKLQFVKEWLIVDDIALRDEQNKFFSHSTIASTH